MLPLNDHQRDVVNRLLEGFDGKLTTAKWAVLTTSYMTRHREISEG